MMYDKDQDRNWYKEYTPESPDPASHNPFRETSDPEELRRRREQFYRTAGGAGFYGPRPRSWPSGNSGQPGEIDEAEIIRQASEAVVDKNLRDLYQGSYAIPGFTKKSVLQGFLEFREHVHRDWTLAYVAAVFKKFCREHQAKQNYQRECPPVYSDKKPGPMSYKTLAYPDNPRAIMRWTPDRQNAPEANDDGGSYVSTAAG